MAEAPFTISNRFLKLLAHHLFGDSPAVALRELIQNAHDAVLMRAAREPGPRAGWGVRVIIDERLKQIEITDTGVGMSADDIINSLMCRGSGAKEDDKINSLMREVKNPEMLKNVAGYFGFGFIASMMVSKKVEIWTKAAGAKAGVLPVSTKGSRKAITKKSNCHRRPMSAHASCFTSTPNAPS